MSCSQDAGGAALSLYVICCDRVGVRYEAASTIPKDCMVLVQRDLLEVAV